MALKFPKTIVEVAPAPVVEPVAEPVVVQPPVSDIEALTAEYIELYRKFVYFEVKDMTKRMEEIRKTLQSVANETMDAKLPAIFKCDGGEVEFSPRSKETEIPNPLLLIHDLLAKFGNDVTASVVGFNLTNLRKLLSEHELKAYLEEKAGGRTVKSVRPASDGPV